MKTAAAALALAALVATSVDAHSNVVRVRTSGGNAGPMGQNAFRDGIVRDTDGIPGSVQNFRCPHCVLENRPQQGQTNGQGFTVNPGAHWDNPSQWPSIPCMSFDGYGQRGTLNVRAGESIDIQSYVNADHGGFYRFEFANGTNPSNNDFMGNPISPFFSWHESAETNGFYPGRVVGWNKGDTNNYINDMRGWPGAGLGGARLNPQSQGADSGFCQSNYNSCFLDDRVTIPANAPNGNAVLRWNWYSLETAQIYTNCIDMVVSDGNGQPPAPTPAPAPTPSPPSGCSACWNTPEGCGFWCGRAWNEGCAAVGCSNSECDFC